ncbi:response regulator [Haliangium sp.]|uniref:response regulator n=1 Tax=Haliangium sp. TaxID=2663208 RepID=UPI003D140DF0
MTNILVIEDSTGEAALTKTSLETAHANCHVDVVSDGGAAIAFLAREGYYTGVRRPDLIVLELGNAGHGGREVLRTIRRDPALSSTPVIVVGQSRDPKDIRELYRLSANAYVIKPQDLRTYRSTIAAMVVFWLMTAALPE